ncbi:acyloxyacyl hydrolase [Nitrosomonas communis]|uniref:acyloxyacyl hydrolase n=1 Tax=Nitrosomonas communis TaxID=44574 RepID=UPI0026EFC2DD|nr:acyloxyacyl hydrolase [Nitrosomonas communis]MCO6428593.1 acyloxyacyl hydrolase [Nitrosomonas communis]
MAKLNLEHNDRKTLGSQVLFRIPIEIGYRLGTRSALSVYFDHVSNASLADNNEGMDTFLGLDGRFGYRF